MSKSMTSKIWAVGLIAVMALVVCSPANAALTIALRFEGATDPLYGDHLHQAVVSGQTYTVDVWAQVTGAVGNALREGFLYANMNFMSANNVNGGAVQASANTFGIVAWDSATTYNGQVENGMGGVDPFAGTGGWQSGSTRTLTGSADLINDLGSIATSANVTQYPKAYSSTGTVIYSNTSVSPAPTFNAIPNGTEFLIGKFTVSVGTVPDGTTPGLEQDTSFKFSVPPWTTKTTMAVWYEDETAKNPTTVGTSMGAGDNVTFYVPAVPEPATMAFLAVGGIGMVGAGLARRRKNRKAQA